MGICDCMLLLYIQCSPVIMLCFESIGIESQCYK